MADHAPGTYPASHAVNATEAKADNAQPSYEAKVLRDVLTWAEQRCPCHDETPDPCPLCGATVAAGVCMSAENTIPRSLLAEIRLAAKR